MDQEEIIAIAIREAFKCGKEEGEAYQRMWSNMNEKIEKAKKGEPDNPRGLYDGFFSQLQNFRASVAPAKPGTESETVAFKVESLAGNPIRIAKTYGELKAELIGAKDEIEKLGKILEEKDAKITELRQELQANKDADTILCDENKRLLESLAAKDVEIAKLRLEVPELKYSSLPLDWYVISQKANHRRKFAERMYRKKYLKKKEECRYQTERADNAFEKISQLQSDLEDCKCELRKYKNNIERAVEEESERQEENDFMQHIVSLQTFFKESKARSEKIEERNEALSNAISELRKSIE